MRFLITGGAGFIGRALSDRLVREGHEVWVVDDLSTGDEKRLHPAVLFHRVDINDQLKLWTLLHKVDCVFHLAARVSVPQSIIYPRDYNTVNVCGTVSIMEAARNAGVSRVVFTSSGAVYGEQAIQPVHEELSLNPDSPYAVSKLAAEHYIHTLGACSGIETVCLRVFNTYGPGQSLPPLHFSVVPRFIHQSLNGKPIKIYGTGKQTRDFVFIDDVVQALISAATTQKVSRLTINIGSGVETNILELVDVIKAVIGEDPDFEFCPLQEAGVSRMCADFSLARRKLNWKPSISLSDGLLHTIERDSRFVPLTNKHFDQSSPFARKGYSIA